MLICATQARLEPSQEAAKSEVEVWTALAQASRILRRSFATSLGGRVRSSYSCLSAWSLTSLRAELVVAMSGAVDYVSDGNVTFAIDNGHHYQAVITGSGCMASTYVFPLPVAFPADPPPQICRDVRFRRRRLWPSHRCRHRVSPSPPLTFVSSLTLLSRQIGRHQRRSRDRRGAGRRSRTQHFPCGAHRRVLQAYTGGSPCSCKDSAAVEGGSWKKT